MLPFRCDSSEDTSGTDDSKFAEEYNREEYGGEGEGCIDEYELGEKDKSDFCAAFTLLDGDGDGVISPRLMEDIVVALGREPDNDNMEDIMKFCRGEGCGGKPGMNFKAFCAYLTRELVDVNNKSQLRNAFQIFGNKMEQEDPTPEGYVNTAQLRYYLKNFGLKLTDDEIDYLWNEENLWMLGGKRVEVDFLVREILGEKQD